MPRTGAGRQDQDFKSEEPLIGVVAELDIFHFRVAGVLFTFGVRFTVAAMKMVGKWQFNSSKHAGTQIVGLGKWVQPLRPSQPC